MEPQSTPRPVAAENGPADRGRRNFLAAVVGLFTTLIAAALAVPFLGTIVGSSNRVRKGLFAKAVPLAGLPAGRPVDVVYEQMSDDGFLRQETARHVWVIKKSATEATVFSPICPHLGCRYDWDPSDALFKCPCHASVFRPDGTVVSGPAPRPLDTLPAEVRDGVLYVEWEQFEVGIPEKKQV
ncbi:MAG TPA: ubiquinol-cytochrome c reductase iron-sulfur subunit [Candidatus Bathyarchaeia archaeon]|nr:ubiquinol-cytochrome c reductase iron-sulfur subunit [Candidatus Bathyarchaeia archaeon]